MLYQTPIGPYDGDSWEKLCQVCLKAKYNGRYIEIPASPGDYGLDGFTIDGDAYQCYCPETECADNDLYDKQRDKITKDINKLNKFQNDILRLLNGVKLKNWYLLTPKIRTNDLLFHCVAKTELVKSWNLPFIDSDFKIIPLNVEYLSSELPSAMSMLGYMVEPGGIKKKIDLNSSDISDTEIDSYKTDLKNSEYTKNAYSKHLARYSKFNGITNLPEKVATQVDRTVKNLLIGDSVLKEWENMFQDQLDKFLKMMEVIERQVSDLCDVPTDDPEKRYKEIQELVKNMLDKEFPTLSETTRMNLAMRVVADWILRCPLKFE